MTVSCIPIHARSDELISKVLVWLSEGIAGEPN